MADNATLPATAAVVAADEIGGVLYQRVKIALGADGSAADLAPGRADATLSVPMALDSESKTALDAVNTATSGTKTTLDAILADTTPMPVESGVKFVDVTLSTDTSAYASGDLIADAQIVAACVRSNDALGALHSMLVIDEDDQGVAFTVWFASASSTFGTENSAPSISDANARTILGFVDVATSDYKDLGGVKLAFKGNIGMAIKPVADSDDIYVAVVNSTGTPTFTASGLKLRLGFLA